MRCHSLSKKCCQMRKTTDSFSRFDVSLNVVSVVCSQFQFMIGGPINRSNRFSNILSKLHKGCFCHKSELIWFISLCHLNVARAPFLSARLRFGVTAKTHNPRREMKRESKSCHIDSEIESEAEAPWWRSLQNNNLFHKGLTATLVKIYMHYW